MQRCRKHCWCWVFPGPICSSTPGLLSKEFSRVTVLTVCLPHAAFELHSHARGAYSDRWGADCYNPPQPGTASLPEGERRDLHLRRSAEGSPGGAQGGCGKRLGVSSLPSEGTRLDNPHSPCSPLASADLRSFWQPPSSDPSPVATHRGGAPAVVARARRSARSAAPPVSHSSCNSFTPRAPAGCGWAPSLAGSRHSVWQFIYGRVRA